MAKRTKRGRIEDVQARVEQRRKRTPGDRRAPGDGEFDHPEKVTLACHYFSQGYLPSEIQALMKKNDGVRITRETPYRYLAYAAKNGWIRFVAPPEHMLRERLATKHPWLQGVKVAHTAVFDDVAHQAAEMLVKLMRTYTRPPYNKDEVHIGFAGGHGMRTVAQHLAHLLRHPIDGLPPTVVFHAMAAGFEPEDPTTAPNAFFTYFEQDLAMQVETRFVGLLCPPIVGCDQLPALRKLDGIEVSFLRASELDIVVTSGSSWSPDCHSMLREYMERSPPSFEELQEAGCCGDMLWRPLGRDGPIEIKTKARAVTLMELSDLAKFIDRGKAVMLVLGPCRVCHKPKTELLETILQLKEHLISHVVADSRSVSELIRRSA